MPSLAWYLRRLGRMGLPEMAHRTARLLETELEQIGLRRADRPPGPAPTPLSAAAPPLALDGIRAEPYLAEAERCLSGRYEVFCLGEVPVGADYGWNRDPRTGTLAALGFGKRIDYRDAALVGDIKFLWEPNRHLQLVPLAQGYFLSDDSRYLDEIVRQLRSWIGECPYPRGPNWTSALEVGIRLINWSWVWRLCGDPAAAAMRHDGYAALRDRWLASIYQHIFFIAHYYSRFSSANNHLIGEASGVYIAACTWPFWREVVGWGTRAKQVLIEECARQNTADGVNREQAIAYHGFVLEFLVMSALYGDAIHDEFPPAYWRRIEAMLEFAAALTDRSGHMPLIGDADDARVVKLAPGSSSPFPCLLAAGSKLFSRGRFLSKAGATSEEAEWLLAAASREEYVSAGRESEHPPPSFFPAGGYYVLADRRQTAEEILAVFDAGPLGYQSIAAHGHADALSLTLSVGGEELLVDSGTYAYHTEQRWREYFRGTAAHNTIRVDGRDQSVPGGNFMWVEHATARCLDTEEDEQCVLVKASHDGYERLPDPVVHERSVELLRGQNRIIVTDWLRCRGYHDVELFWHFAESAVATVEGDLIRARLPDANVTLRVSKREARHEVLRGSEHPMGGWISRRFAVKEPTTTVVWRWSIEGDDAVVTTIEIES